MTHDPFQRYRYNFAQARISRIKRWKLILILVLSLAIVLTLVAVAATAFLVLFPAVLLFVIIGGLIARWRNSTMPKPQQQKQHQNSHGSRKHDQIIDAEYVIITDRSNDEKS